MPAPNTTILGDIMNELKKSRKENACPDHPSGQACMVSEPAGELVKAAQEWKYNRAEDKEGQDKQVLEMRASALKTAALCIRFIENLKG